jgi:Predicted dehydrogenases and related proteins
MKIVLIGCGLIADSHAQAIREIDGAALAGAFDNNPAAASRIGDEYGCPVFSDAVGMLDKVKPDVAVICVPTFVHGEYVKLCAMHGVSVLCEKPLERSVEACTSLLRSVKDSGIVFMTAQVVRFWSGYVEIKEMYDRGEIGDVYMMHLRRVSSRAGQYGQWLFNPDLGGGAMHDMLVHDVDYLRYFAGPFQSCFANAVKDDTGCYNNVMANIVHKNGVRAVAEVSFTMQTGYPFSFSVHIVGTKATIEYSYSAGATIADRAASRTEMKIWRKDQGLEEVALQPYDAYKRQMEHFLTCVSEKRMPCLVTPDESYDVIAMIDSLHASADNGTIMQL